MDSETVSANTTPTIRTAPTLGFIATSVVASAVGVVVAEFVDDLGLAIGGAVAGREPILFDTGVVFQSTGSDLAYAGGLLASLLVGAFFLLLYPASNRYDAARLTTLWIVLHCFRKGFVQLAGMPLLEGSAASRAYATLDVPAGLELIFAVGGAVGILSVALASAPAFLAYATRQKDIDTPGRRFKFTAKLALIGGVAGPLLTVPFFLGDETGFVQTLPLLGLFTIATVLAALGTTTVQIVRTPEEQRSFSWLPVAWLVVLFVVYQFVLSQGVYIPPDLAEPFATGFER